MQLVWFPCPGTCVCLNGVFVGVRGQTARAIVAVFSPLHSLLGGFGQVIVSEENLGGSLLTEINKTFGVLCFIIVIIIKT